MRFSDVPSTSIKLMLFPFSLEGSARIWLEKEPPRSILTWDDLVSKFINQFFSPQKTTNLRNEITRFQQRFDESFYEAWDRFNDLLRACPHHGFSELHQLDTFYNALNANDQDSLNSAAGGNFLDKMPRECLRIIERCCCPSQTEDSELRTMMKRLCCTEKQRAQAPAPVKAVEQSCVTCGGQVYQPPTSQPPVYQAQPYQAPAPQVQGVSKTDFENYVKANDAVLRNMQNQGQGLQNQIANLTDMLSKFVTSNTASTSGTLPSNTVTNPKEDLKGITTRSGVAYKGPTIPITSSPKVMERETEVTKDTMPPTNNGSTEDVQPPVVPVVHHESISEPVNAPVSASMPNQKASIPFPSRRNDERRPDFMVVDFEPDLRVPLILGRSFLKTSHALIDVYEGEITLRVGREAITFNMDQTSRYTANYNHMTANQIDVIDMACE
ncbi:reverse transcriptase domain-containing protein [Tanacetum coccineum]|uniref:Reverse transcriptase domain-containing protein n=1 Tax=Tanacetum coccineum TaxID=301880 RepID=A0ABQ4XL81_9ASTR